MIFLLRKPPTHFKDFVVQYFRERAHTILLSCKAYISGHAKIGDPIPLVTAYSPNHPTYEVSQNFQSSMGELYPRLLDWFASKGASVENLRTQFQFPKPPASIKKKDGIAKKIFNTCMKLIGLK
ncbi:(E3-independent) E2 ubiquitin-conjugating enzyme [Ranunculus cassubicifolius]